MSTSGPVNQFIDFTTGTGGDSGENDPTSIEPFLNGEDIVGADPLVGHGGVFNRPGENLRQRTEAVRGVMDDTLYLRDADRTLMLGGPGKVTWPGSTTAAASGIPTIDDDLYIIPALTPGAAQAAPTPPVASKYGSLKLAKTGGGDGLVITSMRRSYDSGDKISVTVVPGASLTVVASGSPKRSILITCPAGTTLNAAIAAINALTVDSPATQLVNATLAGGANGAVDTLAVTQAKQYVAGNYDGEGHAITPAALASFFATNPTSALAEGDTLAIQYANMTDSGLGGRRQSLPENANTSIPAASFFNSRLNPEKLVNAIPVCKVINGRLAFINGIQVPAGAAGVDLGGTDYSNVTADAATYTFGARAAETLKARLAAFDTAKANLDTVNVFATPDETDANGPFMTTTVVPTSAYKPLGSFQGTGSKTRTYVKSANGGYVVTCNAYWNPATGKWHQENNASPSTYMALDNTNGWAVRRKAAGQVAEWLDSAWDISTTLDNSGDLTAGGSLRATASSLYQYWFGRTSGQNPGGGWAFDTATRAWKASAGGATLFWHFPAKFSNALGIEGLLDFGTTVSFFSNPAGATPITGNALKMAGLAAGPVVLSTLGSAATSGAGYQQSPGFGISNIGDTADQQITLEIVSGQANDLFYGWMIGVTVPVW